MLLLRTHFDVGDIKFTSNCRATADIHPSLRDIPDNQDSMAPSGDSPFHPRTQGMSDSSSSGQDHSLHHDEMSNIHSSIGNHPKNSDKNNLDSSSSEKHRQRSPNDESMTARSPLMTGRSSPDDADKNYQPITNYADSRALSPPLMDMSDSSNSSSDSFSPPGDPFRVSVKARKKSNSSANPIQFRKSINCRKSNSSAGRATADPHASISRRSHTILKTALLGPQTSV